MSLKIQYAEDQNGLVFNSHRDDSTVTGFTRDRQVSSAAIALADIATHLADRLQPSAFDVEIIERAKPLRQAWKVQYDDVLTEKRAISAAEVRMAEIPPSVRRDHFPEIRASFKGLDTANAAQTASRADLETLAALIDAGQHLTGLSDPVWEIVQDRYLVLATIERLGLLANYQQIPTVGNLLATGPDLAAAEKAVREMLAAHEQRKDDLVASEIELLSMLKFMANVEHRSVDDVLQDALAA